MASSGGCVPDMSNPRFEVVNNHFGQLQLLLWEQKQVPYTGNRPTGWTLKFFYSVTYSKNACVVVYCGEWIMTL